MRFKSIVSVATACALWCAASHARADITSDLLVCSDERVKTAMLSIEELTEAESACTRVLDGDTAEQEREKAAFFRGLLRFLQLMQNSASLQPNADGSLPDFKLPTIKDVSPALSDIETALAIAGPLKTEALALRTTIYQTIGQSDAAASGIEQAMKEEPTDPTALVQRSLETERTGDLEAAISDLNRALEIDPQFGPALTARAFLLRRVGHLAKARGDLTNAIALGPPFRRLALIQKSEIEARIGDLRASFEDILSAARETDDMSAADAGAMNLDLLIRAGDLALDSLKDPDNAESLYNEAGRLAPGDWRWQLGLARVSEMWGDRERAVEIYKRILDATHLTPELLERNDAAWRLNRLTKPLLKRRAGEFSPGFEVGIVPENRSKDGLKRLAFVIGSTNYTALSKLPNARRDAAVIANRLAEMGFDTVEIAEDVGRESLINMPAYIARQAAEADIVVVFYAGHGVETGGVNYLIPIDAAVADEGDLQGNALALQDLTEAASRARKGALVIVDACRDDPFVEAKAVAASRGLARPLEGQTPAHIKKGLAVSPTPAVNNIVLHSTQPGSTAADGDALDSPFVIALLQTLSSPGLTMDEVVAGTASRVLELTNGKQLPTAYGSATSVRILPET
ncbi:caspase family protein [Shinella curvata]|uniref:Caspase family protein n=1 Tax=Shinella curvata TaxID=1817964 RepID=A0ABT8XLF1_9HYPH|nr:caspase family protein [Shinella curvata]MCJ8056599.1 caspase family protein [Shinella curvata]MDO6124561.1 caspase family protein [Shinella curvata]